MELRNSSGSSQSLSSLNETANKCPGSLERAGAIMSKKKAVGRPKSSRSDKARHDNRQKRGERGTSSSKRRTTAWSKRMVRRFDSTRKWHQCQISDSHSRRQARRRGGGRIQLATRTMRFDHHKSFSGG